jgi:8-oxo-dGTP pyrophosphatase MutT (NUDIX family)
MVWGFQKEQNGDPSVLLIRRTETVETHKGQMAFPGGMRDPEDLTETSTAIRESQEEVGLCSENLQILGVLPQLATGTGFLVSPVLAWLHEPIDTIQLVLNPEETAEVIWVPRSELLKTYRREWIPYGSVKYPTDVFLKDPYRVWGVTGALLKNLLDRLDRLG